MLHACSPGAFGGAASGGAPACPGARTGAAAAAGARTSADDACSGDASS